MQKPRISYSFSSCIVVLLLLVAGARIVASWRDVSLSDLSVWGDRDLWRALAVPDLWPVAGPESNGGTQLPGGAFYLLLATILGFQPTVLAAQMGVVVLFGASAILLGWVFWREVSPLAGALVAAAYTGSGLLPTVLMVWNPGYLPFFAAAATVTAYLSIKTGRLSHVAMLALCLAIGMQIHMQTIWLVVAVLTGAAASPRLRTWRHGAVFLLCFLVPYLPSLGHEGFLLLTQAASTPKDALANYAIDDFRPGQKIQLVTSLLGGSALFDSTPPSGPLRYAWLLGDAVAVILVVGFIVGRLRHRFRDTPNQPENLFAVIALLQIGVTVFFFVNLRHVVSAVPAVAVMTGLTAEKAVCRLRGVRHAQPVAVLLCLLLALRPLALSHWTMPDYFGVLSVGAQSEIAVSVKSRYYPDRESFEAHAGLLQRDPMGRWQVVGNGVAGPMAFLYETAKVGVPVSRREDCLAIVPKGAVGSDPTIELGRSPLFTGLSPTFANASESLHFKYFPYRTASGNCLKSFGNPYVPTSFEARYLPPDITTPSAVSVQDAAVFVAPQAELRFPLGLEIRRDGPHFVAVMHGRLLRGYTGLYFRTITNLSLCLSGPAGIGVVPFGKFTVGSPQKGTLVPWRSGSFDVSDGTYGLWLTGTDPRSGRAVEIPLGELTVPALSARPPSPGAEALPQGCGAHPT